MRIERLRILAVLALAVGAVITTAAVAANPHFIKNATPTCSLSGDTVTCTGGKIAGVGTEPTQVGIDLAAGCGTKGNGNEPKGHIQAVSAPIEPNGGNITFTGLSASPDCPPGLNTVFGTSVQFFIVQNGQRTNVGAPIPIT